MSSATLACINAWRACKPIASKSRKMYLSSDLATLMVAPERW
ncbi:Uncharacterised protein [Vibrio cholerae]|nr:Uncharacterised protein [Vibrio cholerae]